MAEVVYFISNGHGGVKIGYSSKFRTRIASMQTSHSFQLEVLGVVAGDRALERELHWEFRNDRLTGEWFNLSNDIKNYINKHCVSYDDIDPPKAKRLGGAGKRDKEVASAMNAAIKTFLRKVHPKRTYDEVHRITGISRDTVKNWFIDGTMPGAEPMIILIFHYGPKFAEAAMSPLGPTPAWALDAIKFEENPAAFKARQGVEIGVMRSGISRIFEELAALERC